MSRQALTEQFEPARVVIVDLATGEVTNPITKPYGASEYRRVRALTTLGPTPITIVDFPISNGDDDVTIAQLARQHAWTQCRDLIGTHFEEQGLTPPATQDAIIEFPKSKSEPDSDTPLISVAVCTLNNDEAVIKTVERILECEYPNFEVVVVDNSSSSEPLRTKLAKRFNDSHHVRHVLEPTRGLSFARNRGWKEAKGDIVVFTDDDVIVSKHWLSSIAKAFGKADHVGCVTGPIIPSELETVAQDLVEQYGGYNKGFEHQLFDNSKFRRDDPLYPYNAGRFGSGANMAINKEALDALNGFATELGAGTKTHGGEDIDILQRLISNNFAIAYEPTAWLLHQHRRSYAALRRQMFRYGVGLGATIIKWLRESRKTTLDVIRRFPLGLIYLLSPNSTKNRKKAIAYPRSLTLLELVGFAYGPIAYFRALSERKKKLAAASTTPTARK